MIVELSTALANAALEIDAHWSAIESEKDACVFYNAVLSADGADATRIKQALAAAAACIDQHRASIEEIRERCIACRALSAMSAAVRV